jgi:predicted transcriptional regulator
MQTSETGTTKLQFVAQLGAAYLSQNHTTVSEIGSVLGAIAAQFDALTTIAPAPVAVEAPQPAVKISKSITPDFLISLEDGKKYKSLKRHLRTSYNMTPDDYRAKWGLPKDYPMVAPNYSAQRSSLAKTLGLGRKAAVKVEAPKAATKTPKAKTPKAAPIAAPTEGAIAAE